LAKRFRNRKRSKEKIIRLPKFLRNKPPILILIITLFAIYSILFYRNFLLYALLLLGVAFIHYRTYEKEPRFKLGLIFFTSFIIDWHKGMAGEILFILLAGLLPETLSGSIKLKTLIAYTLMIFAISIPLSLIHSNIVLVGIIVSACYYLVMFIVYKLLKEPIHKIVLEVFLPAFLNLIYFYNLAKPLLRLFDYTLL